MPVNDIYKKSNVDAFNVAEPYQCGTPCPETGSYVPLGEDNAPKWQRVAVNGFSESVTIESYKVRGYPIQAMKSGTAPKAGSGHLIIGGSNSAFIKLRSDYLEVQTNGETKRFYLSTFTDRGTNRLPRKLGLVLVGAGGGAGGRTWYDPNKNGKDSDQFACAGTGGGGGGTLWGVIDIEITQSQSEAWYYIGVGSGGAAGYNHYQDGTSHNSPHYGTKGGDGGDTILYAYNIKDVEHWKAICKATGGKGGNYGYWSGATAGGNGGTYDWYNASSEGHELFHGIAYAQGGGGCASDPDNDHASGGTSFDISFLKDETGGGFTTHAGSPGAWNTRYTEKGQRDKSITPGGSSYGRGANPGDDQGPELGGGGANYGSNNSSSYVYGAGAAGYWAIYY